MREPAPASLHACLGVIPVAAHFHDPTIFNRHLQSAGIVTTGGSPTQDFFDFGLFFNVVTL
jgi:hypothetical protein